MLARQKEQLKKAYKKSFFYLNKHGYMGGGDSAQGECRGSLNKKDHGWHLKV